MKHCNTRFCALTKFFGILPILLAFAFLTLPTQTQAASESTAQFEPEPPDDPNMPDNSDNPNNTDNPDSSPDPSEPDDDGPSDYTLDDYMSEWHPDEEDTVVVTDDDDDDDDDGWPYGDDPFPDDKDDNTPGDGIQSLPRPPKDGQQSGGASLLDKLRDAMSSFQSELRSAINSARGEITKALVKQVGNLLEYEGGTVTLRDILEYLPSTVSAQLGLDDFISEMNEYFGGSPFPQAFDDYLQQLLDRPLFDIPSGDIILHDAIDTFLFWLGDNNMDFLEQWISGNLPSEIRYEIGEDGSIPQQLADMMSQFADQMRNRFYDEGGRSYGDFDYDTFRAAYETMLGPLLPNSEAMLDLLQSGEWSSIGDLLTALAPDLDWSSVAVQVGGFALASVVDNGDGTITYTIRNIAGAQSFFYHLLRNSTEADGPMHNVTQIFTWTENIDFERLPDYTFSPDYVFSYYFDDIYDELSILFSAFFDSQFDFDQFFNDYFNDFYDNFCENYFEFYDNFLADYFGSCWYIDNDGYWYWYDGYDDCWWWYDDYNDCWWWYDDYNDYWWWYDDYDDWW